MGLGADIIVDDQEGVGVRYLLDDGVAPAVDPFTAMGEAGAAAFAARDRACPDLAGALTWFASHQATLNASRLAMKSMAPGVSAFLRLTTL
jgi:hypothetical protein